MRLLMGGGGAVTEVQIRLPPNSLPRVWGHCSHLPSLARRSPRDCWNREARVGLPCPPPPWGSASWKRLPTNCGERGGLSIAQPIPTPGEPPQGGPVHSIQTLASSGHGPRCQGLEDKPLEQVSGQEGQNGGAECRGAGLRGWRGTWSWLWASISTTEGSR